MEKVPQEERPSIQGGKMLGSLEEMERYYLASVMPAFCEECEEEVTSSIEPDADWIGGENETIYCHNCGPGTRCASILVYCLENVD